jgi:Ca2+-binding RTX toxin-like protein
MTPSGCGVAFLDCGLESLPRSTTRFGRIIVSRGTQYSTALLAGAAVTAVTAVTLAPAGADVIPLKDAAMITHAGGGFRYTAGQQDTHLVVTRVAGGVRFADRGTAQLRSHPRACREQRVRVGIAAVCPVPTKVSARRPMTLEIIPRLGDDFVDSSSLSAAFEMYVLADAGRDVVRTGAGDDFVNGAQNNDRIRGGAGKDWIRTGIGNDTLTGGRGADLLVGVEGQDTIYGGGGDDEVRGGPGQDRLYAGEGSDMVACGTGRDRAQVNRSDSSSSDCESTHAG